MDAPTNATVRELRQALAFCIKNSLPLAARWLGEAIDRAAREAKAKQPQTMVRIRGRLTTGERIVVDVPQDAIENFEIEGSSNRRL
jgi:hypothetical protein